MLPTVLPITIEAIDKPAKIHTKIWCKCESKRIVPTITAARIPPKKLLKLTIKTVRQMRIFRNWTYIKFKGSIMLLHAER